VIVGLTSWFASAFVGNKKVEVWKEKDR